MDTAVMRDCTGKARNEVPLRPKEDGYVKPGRPHLRKHGHHNQDIPSFTDVAAQWSLDVIALLAQICVLGDISGTEGDANQGDQSAHDLLCQDAGR